MSDALSQQKEQFAGGIPECGADTLRMTLCSYPIKGSPYSECVWYFAGYSLNELFSDSYNA